MAAGVGEGAMAKGPFEIVLGGEVPFAPELAVACSTASPRASNGVKRHS